MKKREEIAQYLIKKLSANLDASSQQFNSKKTIRYFYIDNLFPEEFALELANIFPDKEEMKLKKSIKEDKYISAQMNAHHPLLEEVLYSFQEKEVIDLIEKITGIDEMQADEQLYAGGLSLMTQNQFLKPHLDNSHDKDRNRYRTLNLLYYVTPDWKENYGGNLQLWPNGINQIPETISSKFNRLVVMETHEKSLHGVNEVLHNDARKCISNYYFRKEPISAKPYYHVTSFYGNKSFIEKKLIALDRVTRNFLRKNLPKSLFKNKHYYKKD